MSNYFLPHPNRPELVPDFVKSLPSDGAGAIAIFDADGTIWTDDVNDDFTLWCIANNYLSHGDLWDEYLSIYAEDPPRGCEFALKLFAGETLTELQEHIDHWWTTHSKRKWIIEVLETIYFLAQRNYQIWVVTGTPTPLIGPLAAFLPIDRVIGMDFALDHAGVITGEIDNISCAGAGKADKIKYLCRKKEPIVFACGNSLMDVPMMQLSTQIIWSVYPNSAFQVFCQKKGWQILDRPADFAEESKLRC